MTINSKQLLFDESDEELQKRLNRKPKWFWGSIRSTGYFLKGCWHRIISPFEMAKRFIDYAPLIWNDCDWDFQSALVFLKFKLQRIAKDISRQHIKHVGWEEDVARINRAVVIIGRILEDNYLREEYEVLDKKYPDRWSDKYATHHPNGSVSYPSMEGQEQKDYWAFFQKRRNAEEKDWGQLWKIIKDHSREWWD